MLKEILDARQESEKTYRRWFSDDYFDLIIWYDSGREIIGFQLCYDRGKNERALTWRIDSGYAHNRIDDGEGRIYSHKMTPTLISDGIKEISDDIKEISEKFKNENRIIDSDVALFVYEKLLHLPDVNRHLIVVPLRNIEETMMKIHD